VFVRRDWGVDCHFKLRMLPHNSAEKGLGLALSGEVDVAAE
jgi:hypothetical protein